MLNQIRWEAEKLVAAFQPVVKSEVKHDGPQIAVIRWEDAASETEQTVPLCTQAKSIQEKAETVQQTIDAETQKTKAIH
jgi:hypothetical protein